MGERLACHGVVPGSILGLAYSFLFLQGGRQVRRRRRRDDMTDRTADFRGSLVIAHKGTVVCNITSKHRHAQAITIRFRSFRRGTTAYRHLDLLPDFSSASTQH